MKIRIIMALVVLFFPIQAISGTLGDVDNDGQIGLKESIYSLSVASGASPAQTISTIIV